MNSTKRTILIILFFFGLVINIVAQQLSEIDSLNVAKLIEFSEATYTDEIMVLHKNEVICHWKSGKCDSIFYNSASMVKSWTGLVIGIMVDKGMISSEDDPVCRYIPEWEDGCKHQVSIKDLLTMSAGINKRRGAEGILAVEDMHQYANNIELDTFPDIRFSYSNESVQLLVNLIEVVSGKPANEYFREVLFDPLGMDSSSLAKDPSGNDVVFGGARTTIEDASKIGLLMSNNGKYDGQQIVSENWIKKSVTPGEHASYYGYLWWIDNNSENKNFAATGDFGQLTIIFPDLDLIFLRQQSCNKDISGNMTWMGPAFLELIASVVKN